MYSALFVAKYIARSLCHATPFHTITHSLSFAYHPQSFCCSTR